MQDGHFGLQRFQKVDDPDDISLLPGAGFFPADDKYLPYERDIVATLDKVCVITSAPKFTLICGID